MNIYFSIKVYLPKGVIEGKISKRKPLLNFINQTVKETDNGSYYELKRNAKKREEWKIATYKLFAVYKKNIITQQFFYLNNGSS